MPLQAGALLQERPTGDAKQATNESGPSDIVGAATGDCFQPVTLQCQRRPRKDLVS